MTRRIPPAHGRLNPYGYSPGTHSVISTLAFVVMCLALGWAAVEFVVWMTAP